MEKLPQISEAEYEVMKVIWEHAPVSTNEITEILTKTTNWNVRTIQTLIKRLTSKGVITYKKQSRIFVYTPAIQKNEYIRQESSSFLSRFFNGNITAMVSSFIENDKLSVSEIDSLRSLLSEKERE